MTVVGHALFGSGLGLLLNPTPRAVLAQAVLAVFVGLAGKTVARNRGLSAAFPFLAAFVVTLIANRIAGSWLGVASTVVLVPALVSLLPAAKLTTVAIDLATGETIAGSARLRGSELSTGSLVSCPSVGDFPCPPTRWCRSRRAAVGSTPCPSAADSSWRTMLS